MAAVVSKKKRTTKAPRGGRGRRGKKGERTEARVLDAAERLFAERGFEAASLREIAREVGINQPGLYNYFASKQALYAAVLERALQPMVDAMQEHAAHGVTAELPAVMTDILLEHPSLAALFQQALQGETRSLGTRLVRAWLDRLFGQAIDAMHALDPTGRDREDLAIEIIAMFNLTTGYFLSQRALESMVEGRISDPDWIARQKALLARFARSRPV